MRRATTCLVILAAFGATGCKSSGFLAKREAEKCCPTDIRKTVPWCAGEDALFKCPCEPSPAFYGYKPTCWRTWPASGSAWRDIHCANQHHKAIITDLTHQNPELIELPTLQTQPTPAEEQEPANKAKSQTTNGELPKPKPESNLPAGATSTLNQTDLPQLRDLPAFEPAPEAPPVIEPAPPTHNVQQEAVTKERPRPILGPIPLPPIDEE